ncbi:MAG TPA: hypothetical protein VLV83_02485, partial [Acidobacteriota bacterium]|nr:hypothetical protein [Acidobacteriota bacterium]
MSRFRGYTKVEMVVDAAAARAANVGLAGVFDPEEEDTPDLVTIVYSVKKYSRKRSFKGEGLIARLRKGVDPEDIKSLKAHGRIGTQQDSV